MSKINVSLIKSYGMALYVKVTIPDHIDIKPKTKVHVEYSQSGYLYYTWLPVTDPFDGSNSVMIKNLIPSTSYVVRCKWTDKSNVEQFSDVSEYMVTLSEADDAKLKASETLSELISIKKELDTKDSKLKEIVQSHDVLQSELKKTQDELSNYLIHHNETVSLLKEKDIKFSDLSKSYATSCAMHSKVSATLEEVLKEFNEYQKNLTAETKKYNELMESLTVKTAQQGYLENTVTEKHGEILKLTALVADLKAKLDKYSSEIVTLNHQINKHATELTCSKNEITNLLRQNSDLESKIVDLEEKIKELTIALEESNTRAQDLESYRKKFDDVTEEKYKLIGEIIKHQETEIRNAQLLREISELNSKISTQDLVTSDLIRQMENLQQNRKLDISDLVDARKLILKQGTEKFNLSSSIADLKKQLDESIKNGNIINDKFEAMKTSYDKVCIDLLKVANINAQLEESISGYKYKIDELSSENNNMSDELDKYNAVVEKLKTEVSDLNANIDSYDVDLSAMDKKIEFLTDNLEDNDNNLGKFWPKN